MVRVIVAGVLGAAAVFIWGMLSWMPLHSRTILNLPGEEQVAPVLRQNIAQAGVYMFPGVDMKKWNDPQVHKAYEEKYRKGPVGLLFIYPNGRAPMTAATFIRGGAITLASALLAAILLAQAAPALRSYFRRVFFALLVGLFAAVAVYLPGWNWGGLPTRWTLAMMADTVVTWLLAGLVIAAVVRARRQSGPAA